LVPRKLDSSCGYAIAAETGDIAGLCASLRQNGADYKIFPKVFRPAPFPRHCSTHILSALVAVPTERMLRKARICPPKRRKQLERLVYGLKSGKKHLEKYKQ
jgi:hypothetical protein